MSDALHIDPPVAVPPYFERRIPQRWPAFVAECVEQGIATKDQLNWFARFRATNGLADMGAVIAKRPNPSSARPILFAVPALFVEWLRTSDEPRGRRAA